MTSLFESPAIYVWDQFLAPPVTSRLSVVYPWEKWKHYCQSCLILCNQAWLSSPEVSLIFMEFLQQELLEGGLLVLKSSFNGVSDTCNQTILIENSTTYLLPHRTWVVSQGLSVITLSTEYWLIGCCYVTNQSSHPGAPAKEFIWSSCWLVEMPSHPPQLKGSLGEKMQMT